VARTAWTRTSSSRSVSVSTVAGFVYMTTSSSCSIPIRPPCRLVCTTTMPCSRVCTTIGPLLSSYAIAARRCSADARNSFSSSAAHRLILPSHRRPNQLTAPRSIQRRNEPPSSSFAELPFDDESTPTEQFLRKADKDNLSEREASEEVLCRADQMVTDVL